MSIPPAFPADKIPALSSRLLHQIRCGDYVVAALFLVLAVGSSRLYHFGGTSEKATQAQVLVQNKIVAELSLQIADTVTVQGTLGQVQLAIAEESIRVLSSSCPHQVCVRQGRIHRPHQMLICAPNHLAVLLMGTKANDLDAITF